MTSNKHCDLIDENDHPSKKIRPHKSSNLKKEGKKILPYRHPD
jgi:hypothetical protein